MRRLCAVLAAALLVATGTPAGAEPASYAPPYAPGPSGGDAQNEWIADEASGRLVLVRVNPSPGAFNCGGRGGFVFWQVEHTLTAPLAEVSATFTEAVVDPYTWIKIRAKTTDGRWLAARDLRGPVTGDGSISAPLFAEEPPPPAGATIVVQFGLEVASACPNVDGGTARFTSVEIG